MRRLPTGFGLLRSGKFINLTLYNVTFIAKLSIEQTQAIINEKLYHKQCSMFRNANKIYPLIVITYYPYT